MLAKLALALLGATLLIWTLLPVYNMVLIALDADGAEFTGSIVPPDPDFASFAAIWFEDYWLLDHFWHQFANSILMGGATAVLTVVTGSLAAFALGRMRLPRCAILNDLALLTYALPTAFLAIPFAHAMHLYGLSDSLWAVIAAQVAFAAPCAMLILHQYGRLIPLALDEAAKIDGASPLQIYLRIHVPLSAPALLAVGLFALLLAWNEYLYQLLLLSSRASVTVAVALNQFFDSDEAPWNYMMAISLVYALPPLAAFFALRRVMARALHADGAKALPRS